MSKPLSSVIDGTFIFKKNGVLANPSPVPTLIACVKPDGTTVTPDTLTNPSTGVYYADQLFSAAQTATLTGTYIAIAETTDTTVDYPTWVSEQEIEDTATITLSAASITAIWAYLTASATTAGTMGKYIVDSFATLLVSITSAVRNVISPVTDELDLELEQDDTYYLSDSRQLAFTLTGAPSITGATVRLKVPKRAAITGPSPLSITGVVTASDSCYVELTATHTSIPGAWPYRLQITLSNGHVITPIKGTFHVAGEDS